MTVMKAPFGQPAEKEPSRYDLRIGDYLAALGLGEDERQSVWARIGSHKLLLGRTVKDVFLDNGKVPLAEGAEGRDLWIFTSDSLCRHCGTGRVQLEFMCHRDIRFVTLAVRESDMFSVGPNSEITMGVEFA